LGDINGVGNVEPQTAQIAELLGSEVLKLVDFAEFKNDSADAEFDGAIGVADVSVESASDAFGDDREMGFFRAIA
jgi:hypothetical protein